MFNKQQPVQQKLWDWRRFLQSLRRSSPIFLLVFFGILLLGWYIMHSGWVDHATGKLAAPAIVQEVRRRMESHEGSEALSKQLQLLTQPDAEPLPAAPAVTYTAQGLRDPFVGPLHLKAWADAQQRAKVVPVAGPPEPPPALTVQGIILGQATPYAIVNNITVAQGDTIAGARVMRIDAEGIVVNFQGEELRYRMQGSPGAADEPMMEPQYPLPTTPAMNQPHFGAGQSTPVPGGETRRSSW